MPNNELNLDELDNIFNEGNRETENMVDFYEEIDYGDPKSILKANIKKANKILDRIANEMNNGNFSARLVEVAGNIINSITASSKEIINKENYADYIKVRQDLVELKAKEVEIKQLKGQRPPNQTNVLVTSREDLLKLLDNKKPKKIENKTEERIIQNE
jgi:hypothetical protein